jgi:aldehyde dehydrogenase (NAD+)
MELFREEVFGPVLAVMRFQRRRRGGAHRQRHPVRPARGGVDAGRRRSIRLAERIDAGTVYVNTYRSVSTLSPVGGYKHSGYGRENGIEAIKEFLQVKERLGRARTVPNPFPKVPG